MTDLWVFIWYKQTISISLEQDSSWNYLFFTLPNKEKIHCKFLTIHQIIHKAADLWLYTARQCILDIWLMTVQHELSEPYSPTWLLWLPTISLNRYTKFDYCVPIKKRQFFSKPLPKLGNTCIWLNLQGLNLLTVKWNDKSLNYYSYLKDFHYDKAAQGCECQKRGNQIFQVTHSVCMYVWLTISLLQNHCWPN